jgi:LPS-assembly lipoprotein
MLPIIRGIVLAIPLLVVTACGFHLRGSDTAPGGGQALPAEMTATYIQAASQTSELVRQLKRGLASAGVQVLDQSAASVAVLTLDETRDKRALSFDTEGRALEYEISYTAGFSVERGDSAWRIPRQTITLSRDYYFDSLDALAADRQEALLVRDMQRELARLVLDRIRAASRDTTGD